MNGFVNRHFFLIQTSSYIIKVYERRHLPTRVFIYANILHQFFFSIQILIALIFYIHATPICSRERKRARFFLFVQHTFRSAYSNNNASECARIIIYSSMRFSILALYVYIQTNIHMSTAHVKLVRFYFSHFFPFYYVF